MTAVPISIRRARADRRQQRERRAELPREMVHAEVGAVGAQLLGGYSQLDRPQQRIGRHAHLRPGRRRPVAERQEPDLLHAASFLSIRKRPSCTLPRRCRTIRASVMAQNKTIPTAASPSAFIDHVADEQRRKDCKALVALMREATGHPPKMWGASIVGFDRYHYRARADAKATSW